MATPQYPKILPGKRAAIAGRTGSGKSTLARWLLRRSPNHWLILNPKWTEAYAALPDSVTIKGMHMGKIEASMRDHKFTIVNPLPHQSTPGVMDDFVSLMHHSYTGFGLCVDELYTLHTNGRAGEGLLGLLTRGRELKQSFIGLTQRPAFVSKFVFSESDYIGGMSLALTEDRKRMYENTGREEFKGKMEPHEWLWYDMSADTLRKFGPVPAS
jgi:hypothetical protein